MWRECGGWHGGVWPTEDQRNYLKTEYISNTDFDALPSFPALCWAKCWPLHIDHFNHWESLRHLFGVFATRILPGTLNVPEYLSKDSEFSCVFHKYFQAIRHSVEWGESEKGGSHTSCQMGVKWLNKGSISVPLDWGPPSMAVYQKMIRVGLNIGFSINRVWGLGLSLHGICHPGMENISSWNQVKPNKLRKRFLFVCLLFISPFLLKGIQREKPASGKEFYHNHLHILTLAHMN